MREEKHFREQLLNVQLTRFKNGFTSIRQILIKNINAFIKNKQSLAQRIQLKAFPDTHNSLFRIKLLKI